MLRVSANLRAESSSSSSPAASLTLSPSSASSSSASSASSPASADDEEKCHPSCQRRFDILQQRITATELVWKEIGTTLDTVFDNKTKEVRLKEWWRDHMSKEEKSVRLSTEKFVDLKAEVESCVQRWHHSAISSTLVQQNRNSRHII